MWMLDDDEDDSDDDQSTKQADNDKQDYFSVWLVGGHWYLRIHERVESFRRIY